MRGPYPGDLRHRVIEFVEPGGSRREAAEHSRSARAPRLAGCNAFAKMGHPNQCPVEGARCGWKGRRFPERVGAGEENRTLVISLER